jgi:uncharacterized protein (TIGR02452 family)
MFLIKSSSLPGCQTARVMFDGFYTNSEGEVFQIDSFMKNSAEIAKSYQQNSSYNTQFPKDEKYFIEVSYEDVISCSYRLIATEQHKDVVLLNYSNPIEPGGGWVRGAFTQEERICRASTFFSSLITQPEFFYLKSTIGSFK